MIDRPLLPAISGLYAKLSEVHGSLRRPCYLRACARTLDQSLFSLLHVETIEVFSLSGAPSFLTPTVASRTRKIS